MWDKAWPVGQRSAVLGRRDRAASREHATATGRGSWIRRRPASRLLHAVEVISRRPETSRSSSRLTLVEADKRFAEARCPGNRMIRLQLNVRR